MKSFRDYVDFIIRNSFDHFLNDEDSQSQKNWCSPSATKEICCML